MISQKLITGTYLAEWRKALGLTPAELADLLGFAVRTIEHWEARGRRDITQPLLWRAMVQLQIEKGK